MLERKIRSHTVKMLGVKCRGVAMRVVRVVVDIWNR